MTRYQFPFSRSPQQKHAVRRLHLPPPLSPTAQFFKLFCKYVDVIRSAFAEAYEEAKRVPIGQRALYLQHLMEQRLEGTIIPRAIEAVGLPNKAFEDCLLEHQGDARFVERLVEVQQEQARLKDLLDVGAEVVVAR